MTLYKVNKERFEAELDKVIEYCRIDLDNSLGLLSTVHHQAYHDCIQILDKIDVYMANIEVKEKYRHVGPEPQLFLNEEGMPFFTTKYSKIKEEEIIDYAEIKEEVKKEDMRMFG